MSWHISMARWTAWDASAGLTVCASASPFRQELAQRRAELVVAEIHLRKFWAVNSVFLDQTFRAGSTSSTTASASLPRPASSRFPASTAAEEPTLLSNRDSFDCPSAIRFRSSRYCAARRSIPLG